MAVYDPAADGVADCFFADGGVRIAYVEMALGTAASQVLPKGISRILGVIGSNLENGATTKMTYSNATFASEANTDEITLTGADNALGAVLIIGL